LECCTV